MKAKKRPNYKKIILDQEDMRKLIFFLSVAHQAIEGAGIMKVKIEKQLAAQRPLYQKEL